MRGRECTLQRKNAVIRGAAAGERDSQPAFYSFNLVLCTVYCVLCAFGGRRGAAMETHSTTTTGLRVKYVGWLTPATHVEFT